MSLTTALAPGRRPLVGMVHLPPLPGSPGWRGSMDEVLDRAAADARVLLEGGLDGVLVENYHDVPFHPGPVPPWTVAALTLAVRTVRKTVGELPVGVNVLRNDARAALGIAAATGAAFLRVNVHTGTMWTDQGPLVGAAWETLRDRRLLGAEVAILADVHVKHGTPPSGATLEAAARDTLVRGLADGLVLSGPATGRPTDAGEMATLRAALPDAPLWVGSGLTPDTAPALGSSADGAIVGTWLHRDGDPSLPLDPSRIRVLVEAWNG